MNWVSWVLSGLNILLLITLIVLNKNIMDMLLYPNEHTQCVRSADIAHIRITLNAILEKLADKNNMVKFDINEAAASVIAHEVFNKLPAPVNVLQQNVDTQIILNSFQVQLQHLRDAQEKTISMLLMLEQRGSTLASVLEKRDVTLVNTVSEDIKKVFWEVKALGTPNKEPITIKLDLQVLSELISALSSIANNFNQIMLKGEEKS